VYFKPILNIFLLYRFLLLVNERIIPPEGKELPVPQSPHPTPHTRGINVCVMHDLETEKQSDPHRQGGSLDAHSDSDTYTYVKPDVKKKPLSTWKLWLCSAQGGSFEIGWAVGEALLAPALMTLGVPLTTCV
jgi:hypothetical protein